ncbi:MAG TPA: HAMP domain-containing sensor histidine kinase [Ktedonobacteraceae bacterium]|nr:HAMP domain-containing sensor histidine kinase [Ktedonobacteraceae bacterium]
MSSRNKQIIVHNAPQEASDKRPGYSLHLQLMLWYGSLVAVTLGLFAVLVFVLTTQAVNGQVDSAIKAEARVAMISIEDELQSASPYWPSKGLSPTGIDAYQEPGVTVEVRNAQGSTLYISSGNEGNILVRKEDAQGIQSVQAGQASEYDTTIVTKANDHVQVKVLPIYPPGNVANNSGVRNGSVIGVLIVAKSREEADQTLFVLRTFLLLSGLTALVGALAVSWMIAAHVLRPVTGIVKTARTIATTVRGTHVGNLSQRVQRPYGNDELALVVDTFNEMLAALESATQAQRRFVADASHELRAPLTTIQGNLAFLQRYVDELPADERRTMLSDAHKETLRLARLVDELLLLARADASSGKTITAPQEGNAAAEAGRQSQPVELDRALLQLVRQLRGRLDVEGSQLKLEIGHIEPARVYGDEETLRRIMLILIDNALKYTPAGEDGAGRITVSLERVDKEAVLHVSDTGIGIDAEDLPHIFERFYRADQARSRQGTGLGLSIAQTLVEQLGGRITAQSTPGAGSTFSVWLPLL